MSEKDVIETEDSERAILRDAVSHETLTDMRKVSGDLSIRMGFIPKRQQKLRRDEYGDIVRMEVAE